MEYWWKEGGGGGGVGGLNEHTLCYSDDYFELLA